jgi:hypothetical protein
VDVSEETENSNGARVRVTFTYEQADLTPGAQFSTDWGPKRGAADGSKGKGEFKITRGMVGWMLILGLSIVLFVLFRENVATPEEEIPVEVIPVWVGYVQVALVVLVLALGISIWYIRALLRAGRTRLLLGLKGAVQTVDIAPEGLRWETEGYFTVREWRTVVKFSENEKRFDLIGRNGVLYMIPKRILSPEQVDVTRKIFNEQIRGAPTAV